MYVCVFICINVINIIYKYKIKKKNKEILQILNEISNMIDISLVYSNIC